MSSETFPYGCPLGQVLTGRASRPRRCQRGDLKFGNISKQCISQHSLFPYRWIGGAVTIQWHAILPFRACALSVTCEPNKGGSVQPGVLSVEVRSCRTSRAYVHDPTGKGRS